MKTPVRLAAMVCAMAVLGTACTSGADTTHDDKVQPKPGQPESDLVDLSLAWTFRLSNTGAILSFDGIAVGPNGHVLVADAGANQVVELKRSGKVVRRWGSEGTGDGQFTFALQLPGGRFSEGGVAVDADGHVYVSDAGTGRVQEFDATGGFLRAWGGLNTGIGSTHGLFAALSGIAVDGNGKVYALDGNASDAIVQKLSPNGRWLDQWGKGGERPHLIGEAAGIAVSADGTSYVSDYTGRKIVQYDAKGTFQRTFGSLGDSGGTVYQPIGLAVDANGNVFVADEGNTQIDEFTSDGVYVGSFAGGKRKARLHNPQSIAVGPDGSIYVVDEPRFILLKFQPKPAG